MTKNMTSGNEARLIFLFTLPIMAGNFLQQLYNTADSIIVGRYVSQSALASVGTCAPLTMLFIAIALGFSTGGSIIISQYYGAKKLEDMRKSVSTALIMVTVLGLCLSLVGIAAAKPLLKYVLGVPDGTLGNAVTYMTIYCVGLAFQFIYNMAAGVLRSLGDSKATLYFLLISSVLNIILALAFVIFFHWGVAGTAAATVISQGVSAVISLIYMFKKYEILRFTRAEFRFHYDKFLLVVKTGVPTVLQQCIVSMGQIAIQRVINSFGTDMMAGITAAARMENYVMIPIMGFQMGMATFSAQNTGAREFNRVISGYKKTLVMVAATCLLIVVLINLFVGQLMNMFGLDGNAHYFGSLYLTSVTPFFILFGCYITTSALLQGAGDVVFAMLSTMMSLFLRIGLTYILAYHSALSYSAIWWAMPIGWVLCSLMVVGRLFQGGWRHKGIVKGEAC